MLDSSSARRWRRLAVVLVTVGALVGLPASPALAAYAYGTVSTGGWSLNVRSGPHTGATVVGSLADRSTVGLSCYVYGDTVSGPYNTTSLWYRVDGGGYVTDAYILTGSNDPVTPACGTRTWGRTNSGNYFPWGQCTWGAYQIFHDRTGVWPMINGNAKDWAGSAQANGWTVVLDAQPRAVVVFQPGVQGAAWTYGHVAWVDSVEYRSDGPYVHITEMNALGIGVWSTRTVKDVVGMSYILAP